MLFNRGAPLVALFLLAGTLPAQRLIPAGTVVECRAGEKIASNRQDIGDPIVCTARHSQAFPFGAELTGAFEDYKDPGHFFGKGWMELRFDRVLMPHAQMPVSAKVVDVKGYRVDKEGRILGKGHTVRDTLLWTVPILWPIDLLNIPRRGPRATLKSETRMLVKLMQDVTVLAAADQPAVPNPYGFAPRFAPEPSPICYGPSADPNRQLPAQAEYMPNTIQDGVPYCAALPAWRPYHVPVQPPVQQQ